MVLSITAIQKNNAFVKQQEGSKASFNCNTGHVINNPSSTRTCSKGLWTGDSPKCSGNVSIFKNVHFLYHFLYFLLSFFIFSTDDIIMCADLAPKKTCFSLNPLQVTAMSHVQTFDTYI